MSTHKLIKISETHYIVVDDSEIVDGSFYYSYEDRDYYRASISQIFHEGFEGKVRKITHSFGIKIKGVEYRPLSEVEDLVNGYSIEDVEKAMISGLSIEQFWETLCEKLTQKTECEVEFDENDKLKVI